MNQTDHTLQQIRSFTLRLGFVACVFLVLGLLLVTRAGAAYEQVGIFAGSLTPPMEPGVFPEEVQLAGVSGMAVNVNGTGGVPPGTVYAATEPENGGGYPTEVARFEPELDGKLKFVEAWEVTPTEKPYKRCGPILHDPCPNRASYGTHAASVDVDVDQTTGNVYVFKEAGIEGALQIAEYNADGSKVISRFGEKAVDGETTASSPEKIHRSANPGAIAVDGAGDVYVFDLNAPDNFYHRLMEFKPQSPGDYEHYVYAGTSHDVGAGFIFQTEYPSRPVIDSSGRIYVASGERIEEYDPSQPASPVCTFDEHKSGVVGMTVDPSSGEVFFYSSKSDEAYRLSACNSEHKFVELEAIAVKPERGNIEALAFDPIRRFAPSRAPGVLYGATPVPDAFGKNGEPGQSFSGLYFCAGTGRPAGGKFGVGHWSDRHLRGIACRGRSDGFANALRLPIPDRRGV